MSASPNSQRPASEGGAARAIYPSPHQEMAGQASERREPDATRPSLAILGRQAPLESLEYWQWQAPPLESRESRESLETPATGWKAAPRPRRALPRAPESHVGPVAHE